MWKDGKRAVELICPVCKQLRTVCLTDEEFYNWGRYLQGEGLIQDMLPDVPKAERELLRGGMCGSCWRSMFGDSPCQVDEAIEGEEEQPCVRVRLLE